MDQEKPEIQFYLERLKKKINSINKQPESFYKSPNSYIPSILEDLNHIDDSMSKNISIDFSANYSISESEKLLAELNLLISINQQKDKLILDSLEDIKGIGPKIKSHLNEMGIKSIEDLLLHFPFRYENISTNTQSDKQLMTGIFIKSEIIRTKSGKRMFRAHFKDELSIFTAVWIRFSNKYPAASLKKGKKYHLFGECKDFFHNISFFHPEFLNDNDLEKIRPIYSISLDVKQKKITSIIETAINNYKRSIPDNIPYRFIRKYNFPSIAESLSQIHSPANMYDAEQLMNRDHKAISRFIYEEFLYIQTGFLIQKSSYDQIKGPSISVDKHQLEEIKHIMPFALTKAQKTVLSDILNDMKSLKQMNRLIQGDVGSGKTIIAFIAALIAVNNGYQVAIIAPTEVLAEQHHLSLLSFIGTKYSSIVLTGGIKNSIKTENISRIESGEINIIIGTHAILEETVKFNNLGLAIIDEQHRFGVMQRKSLIDKGYSPHILLMTATPIPRTLAISCYGDLDISLIDELPPGRIPIITKSADISKISQLLPFIQKEINKGRNIFFVYPLIEESDKMDIQSATEGYNVLDKQFGAKVALLHGKMKSDDKRNIIECFKSKNIRILISTTVIEVGIDMPEATVMVIMNAERFGLAQLHQLRGRVGRSNLKSYCFLMHAKSLTDEGKKRIDAMCKYGNGFKLSEIDLEIRGPGDFLGTRQSGIPELKFANLLTDAKILQQARNDASEMIRDDPFLEKSENFIIKQSIKEKWSKSFNMINIG